MKTVTINTYKFAELSEDAQQVAINDQRQSNYENSESLYFFNDYCNEEVKNFGFTTPKVQYSLGYSQGDGLSFSAKSYDNLVQLFINELGIHHSKMAAFIADNCIVELKGNTGRYAYASKSDIDIYLNTYASIETPLIDQAIENVQSALTEIYLDLCRKLENTGYAEIEYQNSDEAIIETIEANDYDFTEDGKLY